MIYTYKKSFTDTETTYELCEEKMTIKNPDYLMTIAYDQIKCVRLRYNYSRSKNNEFFCRIILREGKSIEFSNKYYSGFAKFYDQSEEFNKFVKRLHQNLVTYKKNIVFIGGITNRGYFTKFALIFLIIIGLTILLYSLIGTFGIILPLIFLGRVFYYFHRNKPIIYEPGKVPERLLPSYE